MNVHLIAKCYQFECHNLNGTSISYLNNLFMSSKGNIKIIHKHEWNELEMKGVHPNAWLIVDLKKMNYSYINNNKKKCFEYYLGFYYTNSEYTSLQYCFILNEIKTYSKLMLHEPIWNWVWH